ncbi:MAG: hypothetical protein ACMXYK_00655, partial [Candidatus Woesearchaeota archaeon]
MVLGCKSQLRGLSIGFLVLVLIPAVVFAATFDITDFFTAPIEISETEVFTFDVNVSVDETLIGYSSTVNSFVTPSIVLYFTLDPDTGLVTIDLPRFFIGSQMSRTYRAGTGIPFTFLAINKSNEDDTVSRSFTIIVNNANEPPWFDFVSYPNSLNGQSNLNQTFTNFRTGTPISAPIQRTLIENTTYLFNVSFFDLDPEFEGWNDLTVSWYLDNILISGSEPGGDDTVVRDVSAQCTHNVSLGEGNSECYFYFGFQSSGNKTLHVEASDKASPPEVRNITWELQVVNVNTAPYFTSNTTIPGSIGTYLGAPLISIEEGQSVTFDVTYTDDDKDNPFGPFELYDLTSFFRSNGVLLANSTNNESAQFIFETDRNTVTGGLDYDLFYISIEVTDTDLSDFLYFWVNVSNVEEPPDINALLHNAQSVTSGGMVTVNEGDTSNIRIEFSDVDANLDTVIFGIDGIFEIEDTSFTSSGFLEESVAWDFTSAGVYNVTVFINDTTPETADTTAWFLINVSQNTAPVITSFDITNSTGGTTFYEGDQIRVLVTYADDQNNANRFSSFIEINGTTYDFYSGNSFFAWSQTEAEARRSLSFQSRGFYNISAQIFDDGGLFSDLVFNDTIFVNPVEVPPEFVTIRFNNKTESPVTYPYTVPFETHGTITANEGDLFSLRVETNDLNGVNTIDTIIVYNNSEILGQVSGSNILLRDNWFLDFNKAGIHNISVFVNDTTGLFTTTWFLLDVANNTAPEITQFATWNEAGVQSLIFEENSTMFINFTYFDTFDNIDTFSIEVDGEPVSNLQQDSFVISGEYFFPFLSAKDNYNVSIFINDTEGLYARDYVLVNVTLTEVPPEITLITITEANGTVHTIDTEGQIVSVEESNGMVGLNNITVFFSATDLNDNLNESSAQISFNGIDYVGSFNQTFYLDFDSQGEYVINITIFDEAGNRNQNLRYFILEVIDNIPPVVNAISILNSSDGSFLAENKTIFFSMDATDENNNLEYCQLFFSSTPFVNQTMFDCDSTYAIFLGFGTQGFYNVTAVAIDTEGLFHNLTETFYIEKTNRSPTITEFRIGNISVLSGSPSLQFYEANPITFFVRATDPDSDLSYIQILVDGTLVEPTCNISASGSESTLSCSWTPGPFENGIRTISAQAFDVAGLSATRNYDILIQENVPPILDNFTITRNGISNTSFIEGDTMNVSFDIIDVNNNVDTFYIDINFSSGQTRWFSTNLSYIFSFDARGTYNVSIFVNDTFGEFATNYSIITVEPFNFHPEIDEVLITELNGTQHIVEENDIITIKQNYLKNTNVLDMIVTASDLNGFETIETYNFSITGPFAYEFEQFSASNEFTWDIDYTMVGDFLVTITVTDETFLSNTTFFTISILNNTPPSIDFNTITNQDEITVFHENDTLTFNMSVSDIDNNIDTYYISIDGTIVSQGSLAQGGFVTYSRYFNFTSRGLYTVLFFVNDTAGMNNTIEQTILINPTEVPPNIYDVAIEVNNINVGYSMGNNISMAETDLLRVEYLVNDVNEDLDTYEILRDGVLVQSGDLFEDQEVVHIWQTTFSDGGIRNVTFVAFDESGNSSTYTFFINISENLAPEIIELAAYNQDGFIDNISNFAQEGETITINVTAFDDDNDFDNAEIVQLFIDGIQVDLNSSGPSRFLTISYDLFLEYTTTNTSKTYNISAVVEDTEGLLGFASFNLTVFHTPVPPVIETLEISINNGAWNEISSGDLVIINETNSLDFRLIGFDINGNSTLRNVSFTLVDDSLHIVNQYEIPYVSNMFTFNTNYSSSGVYNLSAALFDMDGLFNETFFIIEVINNEAPVFTQLDVFNQNTVNCMTSECVEGDTITINVTIIDDFSPIDNISIFLNNSLVAICEGAYNCSYSTFFNFTSRGTWNFTVFAYDDEPLVNRSELLFTIGPTEVAPEIDTIIINSTLLQQEWVLTEDNFSCTGGVWSNRDCMYIGVPFSFSETDTIRISFNATDVNEDSLYRSRLRLLGFDQNSFEYQQIAFSPLGVYNHAFFLDSDYFEDYGTDVMQLNSFVFDTPSGPTLKVDFTINFTIINNEAPVIDDILIVNSTGGTSYFEGDLLNISFDYSDINNNVDVVWFTINTSSEIIVYNNTGIIPLNLSSFGTYELCAFARDTEPLTTSECEIFVINPVNFDPEITRVEVFNG